MTQEPKEEKQEAEVQPIVPNWTFPLLPEKSTQPTPVFSQISIKKTKTDKPHE